MSENMAAAFAAAAREEPDEDVHRLAYADWLEDHGDPERAELIRVQIDLDRNPESEDAPHWRARQEKLLGGGRKEKWTREAEERFLRDAGIDTSVSGRAVCAAAYMERGFPVIELNMVLRDKTPVDTLIEASKRHPVSRIFIEDACSAPALVRMLSEGVFNRVRVVCISCDDLDPDGVASILEALQAGQLHHLGVRGGERCTEEAACAVADASGLVGLRSLQVGDAIGDMGVRHVLRSPVFGRSLRSASFPDNALTREAMVYVSGHPVGFHDLSLSGNDLEEADWPAFSRSAHPATLRRLLLNEISLTRAGLKELLQAYYPQLTELDIDQNTLGTDGESMVLEAVREGRLPRLETYNHRLLRQQ